ncbi:MAG TPA: GspE/PulE family protein [Desulfitobacteriaceae bacterium]|nr:GspE/PulE family protein [Desulfitobacteriaceae bacterium]
MIESNVFKKTELTFAQFLLVNSYINSQELAQATKIQNISRDRIGKVLVRLGILSPELLQESLSKYLNIPVISLTQVKIDPAAARVISEELACRYSLIPIDFLSGVLRVAIADPTDSRALDDVQLYSGYQVEPILAGADEIRAAIGQFLTVEKTADQLLKLHNADRESQEVWAVAEATADFMGRDAPTIRLVDTVLGQAVIQGASDIHWEPQEYDFIIRFRIDGRLSLNCRLSLDIARNVLSRLKVMAGLDIAERRLPQDGRILIEVRNRRIDLRISTLPTVHGEKIVVRILDPETAKRSLDALGMCSAVEAGVRKLLKKPHGLILVTGPTGSGKTTTLYALMRELRAEIYNVVSIEDPVEYRLTGVNQIQVQGHGLTFAKGLRSILRQDPDIIMIGEIRDEETARIAVAAALTGHLVVSTLHTNSAALALTRLLDMGIEPYLLAAAVNGILSQRLVRVLCTHCKKPYPITAAEKQALRIETEINTAYLAQGCTFCRETGYNGRMGIHELLLYNQEIKKLVLAQAASQEIECSAISQGMAPLIQDGLSKVSQGLTSLEEVFCSATDMDNIILP